MRRLILSLALVGFAGSTFSDDRYQSPAVMLEVTVEVAAVTAPATVARGVRQALTIEPVPACSSTVVVEDGPWDHDFAETRALAILHDGLRHEDRLYPPNTIKLIVFRR